MISKVEPKSINEMLNDESWIIAI